MESARRSKPSAIYHIRLATTREDSVTVRGLRWVLKMCLRRYGLRCTSIEVDEPVYPKTVREDAA